MPRRIFTSSDRVSISRPGRDALTSPRTSDYMALDSSIEITRPVFEGILLGVPINNVYTVFYGQTFPAPPAVEIFEWQGGGTTSRNTIWRYHAGSSVDIRCPVGVFCSTQGFGVRIPSGGFVDSSYISTPRNWVYICWRTW